MGRSLRFFNDNTESILARGLVRLDWQVAALGDFAFLIVTPQFPVFIFTSNLVELCKAISGGPLAQAMARYANEGERILIITETIFQDDNAMAVTKDQSTRMGYTSVMGYLLTLERQGVMVIVAPSSDELYAAVATFEKYYEKDHLPLQVSPSAMFDFPKEQVFLAMIPGISVSAAKKLLDEFSSIAAVIGAITKDTTSTRSEVSVPSRARQFLIQSHA